jgi:hypothetical protein
MEAVQAQQQSAEPSSEGEQDQAGQDQRDEQAEQQGTGPVGQGVYVVKQGDCIASIAKSSGHFWDTIWQDSGNSQLREVRKDPHVLLPGDRVTVPPLRKKQEPGETEMRHRFVRRGEPEMFRIRVLYRDEPRANEPYELKIDQKTYTGTTDPEGAIARPIPGNAQRGWLKVGLEPRVDRFSFQLGELDPITEISGIQARLNNIDLDCGSVDGVLGPRTRRAIKRLQRREGLKITGEPDQATQQKLKELHRC